VKHENKVAKFPTYILYVPTGNITHIVKYKKMALTATLINMLDFFPILSGRYLVDDCFRIYCIFIPQRMASLTPSVIAKTLSRYYLILWNWPWAYPPRVTINLPSILSV